MATTRGSGPAPYVNYIHRPRPSLPKHMATTRGSGPTPYVNHRPRPLTAPTHGHHQGLQAPPLMSITFTGHTPHPPHCPNTWPPPGALPLMSITFTGHTPHPPHFPNTWPPPGAQGHAPYVNHRPRPLTAPTHGHQQGLQASPLMSITFTGHTPLTAPTHGLHQGLQTMPLCQSKATPPSLPQHMATTRGSGPAPYVNHRPRLLTAPTHGHHQELQAPPLMSITNHTHSHPQHMATTRGSRPCPLCQSQTTHTHTPNT